MSLYAVRMDVDLLADLLDREELVAREKTVADNDALHEVLWGLPRFPYMTIEMLLLAQHPSTI